MNPLHRREIDHQAALDRPAAADVVTAPADGDFEVQRPRQLDGIGNVGGAVAPRNQRGPLVDQPVVHAPRVVVCGV
jgi:hypothetical protein